MKFCPQCGTTFESGARFCLECGFDRSTVEAVEQPVTTVSENTVDKIESLSVEPEPEPVIPQVAASICPQCSSALVTEDRFCQECGFDTSAISTVDLPADQPIQPVVVENIFTPAGPVEEPVSPKINKQFCEQCGIAFDAGDRFCPDCGFDSKAEVQKNIISGPPIVESVPPPPPPMVQPPAPAYIPPVRQQEPPAQPKSKKTWIWIVLAVLALGALGAGGWFGYNKYIANNTSEPSDTTANTITEALPEIDTTTLATDAIDNETITPTEQPKPTTKPMSRVDQELAKQKAKQQQNKPSQPANTSAQQTKPDQGVKITSNPSNPAINDKMVKVIFEVGRKEDAKSKNPKNPTKLMIQKPTMIVRITTDHFNNGMGTSGGGTISIKDRDGNSLGSFRASGKKGKDGTPNSKWVVTPNIMLEKGTYFIWDSDMSTWSKNFVGTGFVVVEGYEVE